MGVADPFAFRELRIRQPGKVLPGRARYEIFDPDKNLLAVAAETESRGVLNTMIGLVPGTRVLAVRTPGGDPVLTLVRQDSEEDWLAAVTEPDGKLIGKILIPEIVANVTFGGPKRNRLYICGTTSLYSVLLMTNGSKLG